MLDSNLYVDLGTFLRVARLTCWCSVSSVVDIWQSFFLETAFRIAEVGVHVCIYLFIFFCAAGCQFYPAGEYLRFVRVPENAPVGGEVLQVEVHPRRNLSIQPVDKVRSHILYSLRSYMTRKDGNRETVIIWNCPLLLLQNVYLSN